MIRLIRLSVIIFGVAILRPTLANAQERIAEEKYSFTFFSQEVSNFKKWQKGSHTGEWFSTTPGRYKGPFDDNYIGAFSWDVISFNAEGKTIYALRFLVGSYVYKYPKLKLGSYSSENYIYYYVTLDDLQNLLKLKQDEIITIRPYGYYLYDFGENITVRSFIRHEYVDNTEQMMLIKQTVQDKKQVIRFTLPYEKNNDDAIFYNGPYYEISRVRFNRFLKSLKKLGTPANLRV